MRVHLDTDLGGDIDDLCALALLLRLPHVEISGITTTAEVGGRRAGYVRHVLRLEGREDIPVAAGSDVSQVAYRYEQGFPPEEAYWGGRVAPVPGALDRALALLRQSVEQGATIVGIGPYTNLCLLERRYPGILGRAQLVLMGGYIYAPREGYPPWGNDLDHNVQADARSAQYVLERSEPVLVPLSVTVEIALRRADLGALRRAGALGELIARQAEAFARDEGYEEKYGLTCPGLPGDIINFQHDPLACAVATGWREGVEVRPTRLRLEWREGWLHEVLDPAGWPVRVVTGVDGESFGRYWLEAVAGACSSPG